jgi:hypothetical protein
MRPVRGAVIAALAATVVMGAAAGVGLRLQPVRAAAALGVANGTVNAAADHVAIGTGLFPNFKNGAVDSWVPLAHAHVDNSPFAEGTASPFDTGPIGQTAAGAASRSQPQYAEARYPKAGATADTVGSPGGPYAHATAVQGAGSATATMAGGGAPAPPGRSTDREARLAALDAALSAWRARFLTPAAALLYPTVHPDASEPDGVAAATVTTTVSIDPTNGLVDDGDSRVATASFGGGSVLIRGLHVSVTVVSAGTPRQTSSVDLGEVSVGGMPVIVGSGGVTLANGASVPLDQLKQANEQLNAALARGGLALHTVVPVVTTSGNQVTVVASGVHVDVQQPPTAPGVPQQFADHTVGEVFADSLAVPAAMENDLLPLLPAPSTTSTSTAGSGGGEARPSTGGGGAAASTGLGGAGTAYPSSPAPSSPGRRSGARTVPSLVTTAAVREKPLWLLLLYFMWQAVIIGTAVSLWWWRAAGRAGS